jgi:hypothetical protein
MQIRRPLAALLTALALVGGGGTLTSCISPSAGRTGTPADKATTTGGSPTDNSLPDNSNRETTTGGHTGGNNG